ARTPYATLGNLRLAALEVESGDFEAAAETLRWAMENSRDKELGLVARLRLARVQLELGKYDEAIALVSGQQTTAFRALFEEVRGDALLLKDDREGARAAYEAALAAASTAAADAQRIERKRQNVQLPLDVLAASGTAAQEAETGQGTASE